MLSDPTEIAIISKAAQANVRDPGRSRAHFENILSKYFCQVGFRGQRILDIGPGQFDFGVLVAEQGGSVVGVDRDPAVLELGSHKGFEVIEADFRRVTSAELRGPYDGMFCKYSLNAFWFHDDLEGLRSHLRAFLSVLKPHGWVWIAPWNGIPKTAGLSPDQIKKVLDEQREIFAEAGCSFIDLTENETRRYGVHGNTANNALFHRIENRSR